MGLCMEGNLHYKIGKAYTWSKMCISKSIGLPYSWKEIYVSNFAQSFS